jgi:DNA processing protein
MRTRANQQTTASPSSFPKRLREINDPPKKLYVQGILPPEDYKWLCVVGSRKFSPYGRQVCESLIAGLSGLPVVIVSGLALGIDSIAHRSALKAGLKTVGVPGSGLDPNVLYPSSSRNLADEILASGGALVSEFEPQFRATAWSFPQRNRIMAGLCDAVLVIEAEIKSGTLITSRLATDYNRDIFAVPGSIFSSTSEGPHMLIKKGAAAIDSSDALKVALDLQDNGKMKIKKDYSSCSKNEMKIIKALNSPKSKDFLADELNMPVSEFFSTLSVLEIKGFIKEELGEIRLI